MSPLALMYILFASSPLFNSWHHESTSPSTWNTLPFEHESNEWNNLFNTEKHFNPSSIWTGAEESTTFEPSTLNSLLRKVIRSSEESRYPTSSVRSIIREMTGRRHFNVEEPSMFFGAEHNTESVMPLARLFKKIAKVNPIVIEKVLSCPVTRRAIEKVLRNVEPETLYMIEKVIRKNVPSYVVEKVKYYQPTSSLF
jgi:hypothetical protein